MPKKRRYKPKPKPLYTPNLYAVLSGDTLTLNPPLLIPSNSTELDFSPPKKEPKK